MSSRLVQFPLVCIVFSALSLAAFAQSRCRPSVAPRLPPPTPEESRVDDLLSQAFEADRQGNWLAAKSLYLAALARAEDAWDDEWGRPLNFRVEGFSNDGSHVLILLVEGNYPQSLAAIEFDMSFGHSVKSLSLDPSFTSRLSRNCTSTLHIIGTTLEGYIVLGTETKNGCIRAERWQLAHNKTVVRDGLSAEVDNNHPAHLSPHAAGAKLEAGTPVEP